MDNEEIVRDQLRQLGGRQKTAGDWHMVQCVFHDDSSPSCGVYLRKDDPSRKFGSFNCLGCGAHGDWNVFAEKAKLEQIKSWNSAETHVSYKLDNADDELLGAAGQTIRSVLTVMKCPEAQKWPEYVEWRGLPGRLIHRVGGLAINDRFDGLAVLFPIIIGDRVRGAVKALYKKKANTSYITMSGQWVKRFGLFPYAYTYSLIERFEHRFVILVEGPRDVLRLLKLGIPAVAVLGANTISKTKLLYITNLGVDQVYVMSDNDNGGDLLWKNIKRLMPDVRRLKLPTDLDSDGKLIKMDPFSAPASVMRKVKDLMRERHGWRAK